MIYNGMSFPQPDHQFMFHSHEHNYPPPSSSPTNLLLSCAPPEFQGVSGVQVRKSMSSQGQGNGEDDMSDDGSQIGEKKKRLNMEQVRTLEKSFELGNKLEPERKLQLARGLGLQPRQIAIWFQNRRARWKTKQLERDYDHLKRQFDALKADNDSLLAHNKKLHVELLALKGRESTGSGHIINLNKEAKGSWNNANENSCQQLYPHLGSTKNMFSAQIGSSIATQIPIQCRKIDQMAPEESYCSLLTGGGGSVDEQSCFWPWPEQQQFH